MTTMHATNDADSQPPHERSYDEDDRLDVPGVIEEHLLMGSIKHARDAQLLKEHLRVSYLLDAENPRKRTASSLVAALDLAIDSGRVELDDDFSYDSFRANVMDANRLIGKALAEGKTVFVFCTHGNNESAVVCITYLMLTQKWTLERAYKHVLQKRPASAPRKAYVEKLRLLELEVHGRVTLRSEQVGPSMIDIMMGLRGQSPVGEDGDERTSHLTEAGESNSDRGSIVSNMSVVTGLHNGSSLRETMIIAEQEEEQEALEIAHEANLQSLTDKRGKQKAARPSCVIS
ncbi:Dual specificity protein phosphatase [Globisporangium polare]